MARTLSVTVNTTSQIQISTGDFGVGAGDRYNWYSATPAAANWSMGEAGLTEWYHGPYSSTTAIVPKADTTGDSGGLYNWDNGGDTTTACTGTGSKFGVGDSTGTTPPASSNTACQIVHIKGATGAASEIESQWIVWANGAIGLHKKAVGGSHLSGNQIFGGINLLDAAITAPTSGNFAASGLQGHLTNGSTTGVAVMVYQTGSAFFNTTSHSTTGNNGNGNYYTIANSAGINQTAGSMYTYRFYGSGYDAALTGTVRDAMAADYRTHGAGGASPAANGVKVTTGTGVQSWTDVLGTAVTSRTSFYDEQYGAYRVQASSNHVNVGSSTASNWGVDGTTVTKRYRPCFIISSWTDTGATPTVTLGGTAQVSGTDFIAYNDTTNSVLWLCLLKDIAGTEGALDVSAAGGGPTIITAPTSVMALALALAGAGFGLVFGAGTVGGQVTVAGTGLPIVLGAGSLATAESLNAGGLPLILGRGGLAVADALGGAGLPIILGAGALSTTDALAGTGLPIVRGTGSVGTAAALFAGGLPLVLGRGALGVADSLAGSGVPIILAPGSISAQIALAQAQIATVTAPASLLAMAATLGGGGLVVIPSPSALATQIAFAVGAIPTVSAPPSALAAALGLGGGGLVLIQGGGLLVGAAALGGAGVAVVSGQSARVAATTALSAAGGTLGIYGAGSLGSGIALTGTGIAVVSGAGALAVNAALEHLSVGGQAIVVRAAFRALARATAFRSGRGLSPLGTPAPTQQTEFLPGAGFWPVPSAPPTQGGFMPGAGFMGPVYLPLLGYSYRAPARTTRFISAGEDMATVPVNASLYPAVLRSWDTNEVFELGFAGDGATIKSQLAPGESLVACAFSVSAIPSYSALNPTEPAPGAVWTDVTASVVGAGAALNANAALPLTAYQGALATDTNGLVSLAHTSGLGHGVSGTAYIIYFFVLTTTGRTIMDAIVGQGGVPLIVCDM